MTKLILLFVDSLTSYPQGLFALPNIVVIRKHIIFDVTTCNTCNKNIKEIIALK